MSSVAGIFTPPVPHNEPVKGYAPGSPERASLVAELKRQESEIIDIPCVVGGKEILTGRTQDAVMPCEHGHVLARMHLATPEIIEQAVSNATAAQREWARLPWQERTAVFIKAAELLAGPWRDRLNASTMLGQSKTCHQAEIDSACEIIDFLRFNSAWVARIMADQPAIPGVGMWNRTDHRPLEGFVLAITPFNFTSIAMNLPTAPAMLGNVVLWKPARTAALSAWYAYQLFREAGVPDGVINFVPGSGRDLGKLLVPHPDLAGVHFTGGTNTFQTIWRTVGENIARYKTYPRLVGETGGKDFILAHPSADAQALITAIVRGGWEYQGQKCSAASRIYVPSNLWPTVKQGVCDALASMKMGDIRDFSNFVGAVIDEGAWNDHTGYLQLAHETAHVLAGGESDKSTGYYVQPTLVQVDDPRHRLMQEEIFGPVVTTYVYDENKWDEVLQLVDTTSPYALTGAVFSQDRYAIEQALGALRNAAGNFYVNDKPTGAVVGQQPFGGARASGTNDKAGSVLNLLRWVSPRTIKETFVPPTSWGYPFLG